VVGFASNEITIEVNAAADGLLVLSEIHYPGWRAIVDDQPAPVVRADQLLRGIPVPAGRHIVKVWYAPNSARIGLIISALSLILITGVAAWTMIRPVYSR
jgi:uncharacterized membrane protein YfhO